MNQASSASAGDRHSGAQGRVEGGAPAAPANSNAGVRYAEFPILTPDVTFFDDDVLIAKGKEFASGLLAGSPEEARKQCREAAESYAETLVNRRIHDGDAVTDLEIQTLSDTLQTEKSQVPPFRDVLIKAEEEAYGLERERGLLGEPIPKPNGWAFLAAGAALGLLFGVLASVTTAEVLWSMFPDEASEQAGHDRLFHLGVAISLAAGLIVGTLTHFFRHYGLTGSWILRHGGTLMGGVLALSLASFRLLIDDISETGGGVKLNVTAIGIVLLGLEVALVLGVELLDSALNAVWRAHHEGNSRIRTLDFQIASAKREAAQRQTALTREEADVARAKQALDHANKMRHIAALLRSEKDAQVAHCKNLVRQGFDTEWQRISNRRP